MIERSPLLRHSITTFLIVFCFHPLVGHTENQPLTTAITAKKYCEFLNTMAPMDAHGFYDEKMENSFLKNSLTRIFHGDRNEEVAKVDEARQAMDCDDSCMHPYRSRSNTSLTQHSSAFAASAVDRHEICGLIRCLQRQLFKGC